MRKRLLMLVLMCMLALFILKITTKEKVFISDIKNIKIITDKNIKDSKDILVNNGNKDVIQGISSKYHYIKKEELNYCDNDKLSLAQKNNGFNLLVEYDTSAKNSAIRYYTESNNNCHLLVQTTNTKFTENLVDVFYNDSVVTSIESNENFEINGLSRITKDKVTSYDNLSSKYSNPLTSYKGLIAVENLRNFVIFDNDNKVTIKQDNDNNTRRVLASNVNNRNLVLLVKNDKQFFLEGYDLENSNDIVNIKPLIRLEITNYMANFNVISDKIRITKCNTHMAFSYSNKSIIIENDLNKLYVLDNAAFIMDYFDNKVIINQDELFYIVNLKDDTKEKIGNIKVFDYKVDGSNIFFGLFDNNNKEVYVGYTFR